MRWRAGVAVGVMIASIGFAPAGLAAPQGKLVASLFSQICLEQLPDYAGVPELLEQGGYQLTPYGDRDTAVEFEFGHPETGIWGAFMMGLQDASCTVAHEYVSLAQSRELGLLVIQSFSDHAPELWYYSGEPSGWTVPHQGRVLYVIFNEGGLSADIRDE